MRQERVWRVSTFVLAVVLVGAIGSAIAADSSSANMGAKRISVVQGLLAQTSANDYVDVPGASTRITIPPNTTGLIVARFSAVSKCYGGEPGVATGSACVVQVTANGTPLEPNGGAFDTDDTGNTLEESLALQRVSGRLGPGTYTLRVRFAKTGPSGEFSLANWILTAELWRAT